MSKTIQVAVAEKIATCGQTVLDTVVEKLADVEISKRIETITLALKVQDKFEKEFKKIDGKEDQEYYVGGTKVTAMSKNRYDEIEKAKQKFEGITNAINKALEENTSSAYESLTNLVNKANSQNNGGANQEKSSTRAEQ